MRTRRTPARILRTVVPLLATLASLPWHGLGAQEGFARDGSPGIRALDARLVRQRALDASAARSAATSAPRLALEAPSPSVAAERGEKVLARVRTNLDLRAAMASGSLPEFAAEIRRRADRPSSAAVAAGAPARGDDRVAGAVRDEPAAEGDEGAEVAAPAPSILAGIVEFVAPPLAADRAALARAGIVVGELVGGSTYSVSIDPAASEALPAVLDTLDSGFRSGKVLAPRDKLRSAIRSGVRLRESRPLTLSGRGRPPVWFVRTATGRTAPGRGSPNTRRALLERGASEVREVFPGVFLVHAETDELERIAGFDSVSAIDVGPPPFLPLLDTARALVNVALVQRIELDSGTPLLLGAGGEDVRIAVFDEGIDEAHPDFGPLLEPPDGAATATRFYHRAESRRNVHGTHVASIVAGNGRLSQDNGALSYSLRGIAPGATLGEFPLVHVEHDDPDGVIDVGQFVPALLEHASDVSNHSYVEALFDYGVGSGTIDSLIAGQTVVDGVTLSAVPQVYAAGNTGVERESDERYGRRHGYYSVFTQAKNPISVGSIDTASGEVSSLSSLGPTFDGRLKPDLVAPGCRDSLVGDGLLAARSESQGYRRLCGTSMAAPMVSGSIALMMGAWRDRHGGLPDARPATYKAVLVQSAHDLERVDPAAPGPPNPDTGEALVYHAGPDFASGHGLLDTAASVRLFADPARWHEGTLPTLATRRYCADLPEGLERLRATLAWDDPPHSPNGPTLQPKLVNDLDLRLVAPDGTVVLPWTLVPPPLSEDPFGGDDPITSADIQPAVRGVDRLNNVEVAEIPRPLAGRWELQVEAFELKEGPSQGFSVATDVPFTDACDRPEEER